MDMLNIDTIEDAFTLVTPQVMAIFEDDRFVWGPKLVAIAVTGPDLNQPVMVRVGDLDQEWDPEWPELESFSKIAIWKATTARKLGMPTSELVHNHPLLLEVGDFFYEGGVVDRSGQIGVGTSGIRGRADETISYVVVAILNGLAHLTLESYREEGGKQL